MIFEKRTERKGKERRSCHYQGTISGNIAAFPLASPLIAGPGAISAIVLTSDSFDGIGPRAALLGVIAVCLLITYFVLLLAERVDRFLGETGRSILTRLPRCDPRSACGSVCGRWR